MWYRNLNLLSVGYTLLSLPLGPRLTQADQPFTLETLDIRPGGFAPPSEALLVGLQHSLFLKKSPHVTEQAEPEKKSVTI